PKKKQPADEERARLVSWISQTLDHPDLSKVPKDPGKQGLHRLSRLEYNNTLRDLLGVDTHPADQFPPDSGGGGGFDNNADTLFIPPVLIEKYFEAAADALAAAKPERLFSQRPTAELDESGAARASLSQFATRGFRRPVQEEELARLMRCYDAARQRGESWEDAMRLSCRVVLISSQFLFRIEPESEGAVEPYPVEVYALASRLSYFLWSSMPDEELLRAAGDGTLQKAPVLEAQVVRMLADPKAHALAENFASQWLRTKELRTVVEPARDKFPQFTPELRDAFYSEPVEFFHALLSKNEALTDCLNADYTFANETLAKFYGIEGVTGNEMRRVTLTDKNRGGILGMAGVLTLTSYPRRTSPVLRGKWVMEEVLGTPPPPPPPLVNTQKIGGERAQDGLTFRQRLEEHRADPACAGCHARMDPLGFGLENFDALGAWRTKVGDLPVDASGQMVTGEKFTGPVELKALLMARKDEFTRALTERMLSYALGRGIESYDWLSVRTISAAVAADGYRAQRLVLEIARSFPFQYRRAGAVQNVAHSQP
ncbi:MAG: Protein of unknown function (DUF1587)/Protein of unknown function (DUF1592)/Protein of unknown, partial [Chthoniobacteraceae bacterium]|nr:Protein of unknown function (DUF1587)/Protein of unknown function (DUF1592)/Protein of unknown [Chthoniobacteraceae bacterium]